MMVIGRILVNELTHKSFAEDHGQRELETNPGDGKGKVGLDILGTRSEQSGNMGPCLRQACNQSKSPQTLLSTVKRTPQPNRAELESIRTIGSEAEMCILPEPTKSRHNERADIRSIDAGCAEFFSFGP